MIDTPIEFEKSQVTCDFSNSTQVTLFRWLTHFHLTVLENQTV